MLFHTISGDPTGAIDLYPHANNKQVAAFQSRFTIIYGKIYYGGNEWTVERIQQEKDRVRRLEETFRVAQAIVECENGSVIKQCAVDECSKPATLKIYDDSFCAACHAEIIADMAREYAAQEEANRELANMEELHRQEWGE